MIGSILKPIAGPDGVVRSADVIIPKAGNPGETSEIRRPAIGLALLEPIEHVTEDNRPASPGIPRKVQRPKSAHPR